MKPATVHQIKRELALLTKEEMVEVCLKLAKFKRDNKELLSYFLFEKDEENFIQSLQLEINDLFETVNTDSLFYGKKTIRKILRFINRFINYSGNLETEVRIRMHYCIQLKSLGRIFSDSKQMQNLYNGQLQKIDSALSKMHEDLQYDYKIQRKDIAIWR